jgi:hypothetical protein
MDISLVLLDLVDAMFLFAVLGLIGVGAMRARSVHERNQSWREAERWLDE